MNEPPTADQQPEAAEPGSTKDAESLAWEFLKPSNSETLDAQAIESTLPASHKGSDAATPIAESFEDETGWPTPGLDPTRQDPAEVPAIVCVSGTLFMIIGGLGMAVGAVCIVLGILALMLPNVPFLGFGLLPASLSLALSYLWRRIGQGLRNGQRSAVYGLCLLGGLTLIAANYVLFVEDELILGSILIVAFAIMYIPPALSAFLSWAAFK
jgi:hypothetical protein